jgi:N-acylneuraminate cytidylyltransferase
MKQAIAIITARGGSKRIPQKNIKEFCGKPILAYSIEAAKQSGIFDEIMVSTDSEEIAEVAKTYGAKVPFMRSAKTSDDYATTADVLMEVLQEYEKRGERFEYMSCIYPTAPFVTGERLREGFRLLQEKKACAVLPIVPFSYPPQRGYVIGSNGLTMKWKENSRARSQDLETMYHDCGQFYFWDVSRYLEQNGEIFEGIEPMILEELEVQDIDNETDWKLAELKYQLLQSEKEKKQL